METHNFSALAPNDIDGVLQAAHLRGSKALPDLLIEVPHGADQPEHYQHIRSKLVGVYRSVWKTSFTSTPM